MTSTCSHADCVGMSSSSSCSTGHTIVGVHCCIVLTATHGSVPSGWNTLLTGVQISVEKSLFLNLTFFLFLPILLRYVLA